MGVVRLFMSMSLDGFVADRNGVEQAKHAADEKDVQVVGGAQLAQQLIRAGLLDQIQVSLMPVLIGERLRLFEGIGFEHRRLERVKVIDSPGRTDIRYGVVR